MPLRAALSAVLVDRLSGVALSAVHARLRSSGCSCGEVGAAFLKRLGIGAEAKLARSLAGVCRDADASGLANPYHSPSHSREVAVDWFCLALLQNALADRDPIRRRLSPEQMVLGLCAAFGHDVGHDGCGNQGPDGCYRAFHLERIAACLVGRRLIEAGLAPAQAEIVRCAILITDPRAGYAALEQALRGEPVGRDVCPEFGALETPAAQLTCAMLRDADLMPSAGMTPADHDERTREMRSEQGRDQGSATPAESDAFLSGLVGGRFLSPAGAAFQADLDRLLTANAARAPGAPGLESATPMEEPVEADVARLIEELGLGSLIGAGA